MICRLLNPIRFYDPAKVPDYKTYFPTSDNVTIRDQWFFGVPCSKDFIRKHIGTMYLQFEYEVGDELELNIYQYNNITHQFEVYDQITPTDISPTGWISSKVYLYTVDVPEGTYYLSFQDGYRSDEFIISESEEPNLIKIEYGNTINDFGCIFDDDFTFTAYFKGSIIPRSPENDYGIFDADRGEVTKTKATPLRVQMLNIYEVHASYAELLNMIFSTNIKMINGIEFENKEVPSWSDSGGDILSMSVKMNVKNNNYSYVK